MKHSELVARPLVTSKEAVTLSKTIQAYKYMECSARNGTGVGQIFTQVIKAVQERRIFTNLGSETGSISSGSPYIVRNG